jgi:LuxR family transcriptional regulator, quorum-sensing system regulator BjaR1
MGQISFRTISAFTDTCLTAAKPEDITGPFTDLLRQEGITSWFVGSLAHFSDPGKGFGFECVPNGWLERYMSKGYHAHDPVFQHAVTGKPRATWSKCREMAAAEGLDETARTISGESADCGLSDGFIMPIHGFGDLPGCVTFGGADLDLSEEMQMSLFLVGAYAYEGLRRQVEHFRPISPFLTPQELRVLRWSAEGKSATDIGVIMNLSAHTVRSHHNSIKSKYGVVSMIQACVLAAMDGTLRAASAH